MNRTADPASSFFPRRTSWMTPAWGSPKTPRTVFFGLQSGK
jgi:hypothetical protein